MKYMSHVDGLRALAVLPVVLFHAGFSLFPGGFVGVDVFFVISGYLITRIIVEEIESGDFSIIEFYKKRVDRLFPVLFSVLITVMIVGWVINTSEEYKGLFESSLSSSFFLSNVYFYLNSSYFSMASSTLPLLHTWSLGVEEQFYIFFPLLIVFLYRVRMSVNKNLLVASVLVAILLSSFFSAVIFLDISSSGVFYLTPFRAWELMVGAIIAIGIIPKPNSRLVNEILSTSGIAAIFLSMAILDKQSPFPAMNAVWPVIGAAMILYSGESRGTFVSRLISSSPLVFIGKFSYSLYMWHWPIFVYAGLVYGFERDAGDKIVLIFFAIMVAIASWALIEKSTRGRMWRLESRKAFALAGSLFLCVSGFSLAGALADGVPSRMSDKALSVQSHLYDFSPLRVKCHSVNESSFSYTGTCIIGERVTPDTVVWGDSHGVELAYVLGEELKKEGRALRQITASACPPAPGYSHFRRPSCGEYNEKVLEDILNDTKIKHVVMQLFWGSPSYSSNFDDLTESLEYAAERLVASGKHVVIGYPYPNNDVVSAPASLARGIMLDIPGKGVVPFSDFYESNKRVFSFLRSLHEAHGIDLVRGYERFCNEQCVIAEPDQVYLFDSHHLSVTGAREASEEYLAYLRDEARASSHILSLSGRRFEYGFF